jgi:glycerophosphoryl diester phosphodiesterase
VRAAEHPYFDSPTPIGLAHRGGAKHAANLELENSLAAFRTAVGLGFRYLETDVHATADGALLAFHDARLDRVTDASGAIAELPYAAVREARINGTEEIPLLSHLLEEFPRARVNIDVKAAGAIGPLVRTVRDMGALDRVCVGSFSRSRLSAVRRALGPRLATAAGQVGVAALRFSPRAVSRWLRTPAPVLQVPTHVVGRRRRVELVTPALVETVHRLGKHLHVWTIDDEAEMHRLFDLGVDGIVSDRIDVLRDVLAARGAPLRG